jgi:hypothetical protein
MLCASPGPALPELASLWKAAPNRHLWTIGGQLLSVVVSRVSVMFIVMAAAPTTQDNSFDWSLLIGSGVTAAVVAGLVSLVQIFVTGHRERRKQLIEFRLRQINELYAPISLLLAQDLSLAKTLREAAAVPGTEWHLLDDLSTVLSNAELTKLAKRIVEVNNAIKNILTEKSGLGLHDELPDSYSEFITHADLVAQGVEAGAIAPNVAPKYFPKAFEVDVKRDYAATLAKLKKELKN